MLTQTKQTIVMTPVTLTTVVVGVVVIVRLVVRLEAAL